MVGIRGHKDRAIRIGKNAIAAPDRQTSCQKLSLPFEKNREEKDEKRVSVELRTSAPEGLSLGRTATVIQSMAIPVNMNRREKLTCLMYRL